LCAQSHQFIAEMQILALPDNRIQAMQDHEFYADPTVFDYWQSRVGDWFCSRSRKLCPYGWTLAFTAMAACFALTAISVFGWALADRMAGDGVVTWNQSMAQVITVMMALLACQAMLQQALQSWPAGTLMPSRLRHLVRLCGWEVPASALPVKHSHPRQSRVVKKADHCKVPSTPSRKDVLAFFAGVRAAGVNVTIARALFSAGVRTPRQLCAASDERLLEIRGVGPATVRKLRVHFEGS
jgi:hypothetical protein